MKQLAHVRSALTAGIIALALAGAAYAAMQWRMEPGAGEIIFSATQAGAPFEGRFRRFDPTINFDPRALGASRFEVEVDLASVDTRDGERDALIRGPELLAVERWPKARYVAERFEHAGGSRFTAHGALTMRGRTQQLPIEFTFEASGGRARLVGTAQLDRLDFGIGTGEWQDPSVVGHEVDVRFALELISRE